MAITATLVKELRERTGAGMMECKKALVESDGDIDAAIDAMRKSGAAKADKKAGRVAAEGKIEIAVSDDGASLVMVEINSETDFAAKDDNFLTFAAAVSAAALAGEAADAEALSAMTMASGESVDEARKNLIAKIGENITVRRCNLIRRQGDHLGVYTHGARIGVVVDLKGGSEELAKDIAMHIAASKPVCVAQADVPADLVEKEKEIFSVQAAESGKPAEIIEKMVTGRIAKFLNEQALYGQPFVKDPDQTVEKLVKAANASVMSFSRLEVGEGIEKKVENFADEVMAQVKGE
ncbi:translation elongation factor Ts [Sulfuriflexus mobilis]|uniref:translation elongation factor Ts n=1 Tax=Sulfuriflexus mobilis TaxID=1811807 RepID=UPI000F818EAB|nr:translation elongation factor Ts [Sulfuriflexus mobilis]